MAKTAASEKQPLTSTLMDQHQQPKRIGLSPPPSGISSLREAASHNHPQGPAASEKRTLTTTLRDQHQQPHYKICNFIL